MTREKRTVENPPWLVDSTPAGKHQSANSREIPDTHPDLRTPTARTRTCMRPCRGNLLHRGNKIRRYGMFNHVVYDVFLAGGDNKQGDEGLDNRCRFSEDLQAFTEQGLVFR